MSNHYIIECGCGHPNSINDILPNGYCVDCCRELIDIRKIVVEENTTILVIGDRNV